MQSFPDCATSSEALAHNTAVAETSTDTQLPVSFQALCALAEQLNIAGQSHN